MSHEQAFLCDVISSHLMESGIWDLGFVRRHFRKSALVLMPPAVKIDAPYMSAFFWILGVVTSPCHKALVVSIGSTIEPHSRTTA